MPPLARPFLPFAARDLSILGLAAGAWVLDRSLSLGGAAAAVLGVASGALVALAGFLVHEWGHLLGAWLGGGVVEAPRRITAVFLFAFDTTRSSRRAFLWMSAGGYAASLVAFPAVWLVSDPARLGGMVALGLSAAGFLVTLALEVPTTVRVLRGGPLPRGGVYAG